MSPISYFRVSVWSAMRSPSPPPIPNRAEYFRITRLFSVWSFDIDTCACKFVELFGIDELAMALIVAMSMKEHLVTQVVIVPVAIKVINFQDVLIFEMQFTPATFSL